MNITFFTGAGISEESGIPTFRTGTDSIWSKYDPDIYCNIKSWNVHKEKMLEFGNELRQQIDKCVPNECHIQIAKLEEKHNVNIITTNVDELHERAGSTNVIHLHGNMFEHKDLNHQHTFKINKDIKLGDLHPKTKKQLRYNIVMFGEIPQNILEAKTIIDKTDILIVIGTSLNVFPAASLVLNAKCSKKYYIDPNATKIEDFKIISKCATEGIFDILQELN